MRKEWKLIRFNADVHYWQIKAPLSPCCAEPTEIYTVWVVSWSFWLHCGGFCHMVLSSYAFLNAHWHKNRDNQMIVNAAVTLLRHHHKTLHSHQRSNLDPFTFKLDVDINTYIFMAMILGQGLALFLQSKRWNNEIITIVIKTFVKEPIWTFLLV